MNKFSGIKKWLLKKPFGFSGVGQKQFLAAAYSESLLAPFVGIFFQRIVSECDKDMTLLAGLGHPVLLEPCYDRVFDIGTTFVIEDGFVRRHFMVENFISEAGGFAGGIYTFRKFT